ncbi:hypothetical protein JL49_20920 [Pseudoalteromonas luteoviolacea]|nr:hypothetical protein JL49_20920 [Pseudoalteromonas luteoviolacea]
MSKLIYSSLTILSRLLAGVFIFYFLALFVSVEDFGRITYFFTLAVILGLLIDYGYNLKLSRDAVLLKSKIGEIIGSVLVVKTANSLLSFSLVTFASIYYSLRIEDVIILYLFLIAQFIQSIGFTLYPFLRADGKYKEETKIALSNNLVVFLAFIAFVNIQELSFYSMALAFISGRIIVLYFFIKSDYFKAAEFKLNGFLKDYITSFSFFCHAAIGYLYFNLDTILLKEYVSFVEVGKYQAAMKFVLAATFLGEAITNIAIPKMVREGFANGKPDRHFHFKFLSQVVVLGIFSSFGFYILTRYLTTYVLGSEYEVSFTVAAALSAVVFIRYAGVYFGVLLTVVDKQMVRVIAGSFALFSLILSIEILGPTYGLEGVALSSLIAHLVILSIYSLSGAKILSGKK